jgi:ATP-dependent Clp protease ATP-binding subunit ClpA
VRSVTIEASSDQVTAIALRAIAIAHEHQHEMVTLEHVLAALLERADVQKCLKDLSIDHAALSKDRTVPHPSGA